MYDGRPHDRRKFLHSLGTATLASGLAGCSGNEGPPELDPSISTPLQATFTEVREEGSSLHALVFKNHVNEEKVKKAIKESGFSLPNDDPSRVILPTRLQNQNVNGFDDSPQYQYHDLQSEVPTSRVVFFESPKSMIDSRRVGAANIQELETSAVYLSPSISFTEDFQHYIRFPDGFEYVLPSDVKRYNSSIVEYPFNKPKRGRYQEVAGTSEANYQWSRDPNGRHPLSTANFTSRIPSLAHRLPKTSANNKEGFYGWTFVWLANYKATITHSLVTAFDPRRLMRDWKRNLSQGITETLDTVVPDPRSHLFMGNPISAVIWTTYELANNFLSLKSAQDKLIKALNQLSNLNHLVSWSKDQWVPENFPYAWEEELPGETGESIDPVYPTLFDVRSLARIELWFHMPTVFLAESSPEGISDYINLLQEQQDVSGRLLSELPLTGSIHDSDYLDELLNYTRETLRLINKSSQEQKRLLIDYKKGIQEQESTTLTTTETASNELRLDGKATYSHWRKDSRRKGFTESASFSNSLQEKWVKTKKVGWGTIVGDGGIFSVYNGKLQGRRLTDGEHVWEKSVANGSVASPLVYKDEKIFTAVARNDGDYDVRAFDASTGDRIWKSERKSKEIGHPVIAGDHLCLRTDKDLFAFDLRDGTQSWSDSFVTLRTSWGKKMATTEEKLAYQIGEELKVLNPADGKELASYSLSLRGTFGEVAFADNSIIYESAKEIGRIPFDDGPSWISNTETDDLPLHRTGNWLTVTNDSIFSISYERDTLISWDLETGQYQWSVSTDGEFGWPTAGSNKVFVPTADTDKGDTKLEGYSEDGEKELSINLPSKPHFTLPGSSPRVLSTGILLRGRKADTRTQGLVYYTDG